MSDAKLNESIQQTIEKIGANLQKTISDAARLTNRIGFSSINFKVNISKDAKAGLALIRHLQKAIDDPDIKDSNVIKPLLEDFLKSVGTMRVSSLRKPVELKKVFAKPQQLDRQRSAARAPRKKINKELARKCFNGWSLDVGKYKNKTAFVDHLVSMEWCGTSQANTWTREFIKSEKISDDLRKKLKIFIKE